MLAMIILLLESMVVTAPPTEALRTTEADGSVWADSWRDGSLAISQRLRAPLPHERWIAVDVDGDGRTDLVAVALDGGRSRVEVWLAGADGFARVAAFVTPVPHAPSASLLPRP